MKKTATLSFIFLVFVSNISFAQLPIVNGWTQFTASNDTRIIYVSDTDGNDATAQFYNPSSGTVGANPFLPTGTILSYRTIAAAMTQLRNGFPDWILLKNGDTFTNQNFGIITLSGRNQNEPILFGAYGTSTQRPRVLTGNQSGIGIGYYSGNNICNFLAFTDIYLEPHTRTGVEDPTGINIFADFNKILIENCALSKFHVNLNVLDPSGSNNATRTNFTVRRSLICDAYTTGAGHANAMFITNIDTILFEENIMDHNGWSSTISGATPTGFRHNSYFQVTNRNVVFKNNIVSRAAATGGGHRCGGIVYDNLYLSNPQNIQFGTHETTLNWPTEYVAGEVAYNVVLDCRIESFDAGRGIRVQRAKNTNVHHNIVAHFTPVGDYNLGMFMNETDNVRFTKNIIYKWGNNTTSGPAYSSGINIGASIIGNNYVDSNDVQMENTKGYCIESNASNTTIDFSYNRYNNINSVNNWFQPGGNFSTWTTTSSEIGGQSINVSYIDPERSITTYLATLSITGNLTDFINNRKAMNKSNWSANYTANTVNNYIRYGFNVPGISTALTENKNENELNLYPNPASKKITIQSSTIIKSIFVYNSTGQLVNIQTDENANRVEFTIENLLNGIYFVKVIDINSKIITTKFIKN